MIADPKAAADLQRLAMTVSDIAREADKIVLHGRKMRVISRFNGQPYGSSRKPLTGQILDIVDVHLSSDGEVSFTTCDSRVNCGVLLSDVEILSNE